MVTLLDHIFGTLTGAMYNDFLHFFFGFFSLELLEKYHVSRAIIIPDDMRTRIRMASIPVMTLMQVV